MNLFAFLVSVSAFFSLLSSPATAQGTAFKSSLGMAFQGGAVFPSDAFQDTHAAAGAAFLIPLSPRFHLEFGADYMRIPVRSQAEGLSQGRLTHIPGLLGLRVRFPLRALPLSPYFSVAAGYAYNAFSLDESAVETYRGLGFEVEETCRSALAAAGGAGVEVILSSKITIDIRGLYRFSRTSSRWSISDQVTGNTLSGTAEDVRLDAIQVTAGLRFFF